MSQLSKEFIEQQIEATRVLEDRYHKEIAAWPERVGRSSRRLAPAIRVAFVTPEQQERLRRTLEFAPIEVRAVDLDVARATWSPEMHDWATHGPSEERIVALLLPRL